MHINIGWVLLLALHFIYNALTFLNTISKTLNLHFICLLGCTVSTWNCLQGTVFCQAKASTVVVLLNSMMSISMANTMNWARNLKLWITIAWAKSRSVSLWFYWTLPALLTSARIRRVLSPVNSTLSVILCSLKSYLLDGFFFFFQSLLRNRLGSSPPYDTEMKRFIWEQEQAKTLVEPKYPGKGMDSSNA